MKTRLIFIRTASFSRFRAIANTGCDAPSSNRASSRSVTRINTNGITPSASWPNPASGGMSDTGYATAKPTSASPR